jgi:hypothetical protein
MLEVAYTADGSGSDDFIFHYTFFLAGSPFLCICFGNGEQGWFSITGQKRGYPSSIQPPKKVFLFISGTPAQWVRGAVR